MSPASPRSPVPEPQRDTLSSGAGLINGQRSAPEELLPAGRVAKRLVPDFHVLGHHSSARLDQAPYRPMRNMIALWR